MGWQGLSFHNLNGYKVSSSTDVVRSKYLNALLYQNSSTSGKAGGLRDSEPLKAV
jgi:hypothetical protein